MSDLIFNKLTKRYNAKSRIQQKINKGELTLDDLTIPNTLIYNDVTKRFIQNKSKNRKKVTTDIENNTIKTANSVEDGVKTLRIRNNAGNLTINPEKFFETVDKQRPSNKKYLIKLGSGKFYTLSTNTINDIIEMIKEGETYQYGNNVGSDVEIIEEFFTTNEIEIHTVDKKKLKTKNNPKGAFFPYLFNKPTEFNIYPFADNTKVKKNSALRPNCMLTEYLERLDIHTTIDDENTVDNCFIIALRNAGVEEKLLNTVKYSFTRQSVPQHKLQEIAVKLDVYIVIHRKEQGGNLRKYGAKSSKRIDLCLEQDHYFLYEKTPFTEYSIRNWYNLEKLNLMKFLKVKPKDRLEQVEKSKYWCLYERSNRIQAEPTKTINSQKLVELLLELKDTHLTSLKEVNSLFQKSQNYKETEITNLEYEYKKKIYRKSASDEGYIMEFGDLREDEYREKKPNESIVGIEFFDIETLNVKKEDAGMLTIPKEITKEWEKKPDMTIHQPFLLVCSNGNRFDIYNDFDCGKKFLQHKTRKFGMTEEQIQEVKEEEGKEKFFPTLVLYAHNAKYDNNFIVKYLNQYSDLTNGSMLIQSQGVFKDGNKMLKFEIRDSYKLISKPLKSFGKMFNLTVSKEYMPYDYYNVNTVKLGYVPISSVNVPECKYDDFMKCANDAECIKGDMIDMVKYATHYCKIDVDVLKKGVTIFRDWIIKSLDIDCYNFYTIPSIAHEYFMREGCYEGCYQVGGVVREFINKSLVGGRTMLCENTKQHRKGKVADYDAVSLYPSAMKRMRGMLLGKPKIILSDIYFRGENAEYDGFFVELKIKAINKALKFPIISVITDKGIREFTNDVTVIGDRSIFCDKETFDMMVEYHKIDYEFVRGYYFDEGVNDTINTVIETVFNNRLKAKKEGNPIQEIWKLIMNSGYGKSITKPHDTSTHYITGEEELDKFVWRHYDWISDAITAIPRDYGDDMYRVKKADAIHEHFNYCHIGIEILSMSKRIMSEVMVTADDHNLDITYTDTDSIHINYDDVGKLEKLFYDKYNRNLTGKGMGQFHIDFDLDDCEGVHSDEFIGLGKKCYIDKLIGYKFNPKFNTYDVETGEHIRLKGVPNACIMRKVNDCYKGNPMKLYEDLYKGKKVTFDLLKGWNKDDGNYKKPAFSHHKSFVISNSTNFTREIQFQQQAVF